MVLKKISWSFKLISLFTGILCASLLIQIFYVIPYVKNREIEQAKIYQEEISNNIAREMDIGINRIKGRLQRISMLPEFRNMDINAMQGIIFNHERISERISSVAVMNPEGLLVCGATNDISNFTDRSYADRPYFSIPFNEGKTYFTPPRYYANKNLVAISIFVPIESESGDRVGVIIGEMDLSDIIKRVADYPLAEGQVAYIIDKEGTAIAHSNIDLFAHKNDPLYLDLECPFLQNFLSGEIAGFMQHQHEGIDYFGFCTIIKSNGWGVIVEAPMKSILAHSDEMSQRIFLIELLLFAISLIITIVFARQITTDQKKIEKNLHSSEQKYRALFDNMLDGFAFHKIVLNKKNEPVDYIFINVNNAFENQTGLKREKIIGKKVTIVLSGIENDLNRWIELYGKVAQTGESIQFDRFSESLNKWFSVSAYSPMIGYFATVVKNITGRMQVDEEIKEKSIELEKQFKKSEEQRVATLSVLSDLNETTMNLKLEITERKRSEQIQKVLYNISNAVITTGNLESLISLIHYELGTIIDTSNFYVALYDPQTDMLSIPFFADKKDNHSPMIPAGKTFSKYVVKTRESLLANKGKIKKMVKSGDVEIVGSAPEIWLGIPLKIEGEVTGVLAVQSYTDENAYNESDLKLLEFVSIQISVSIHRKKTEQDLLNALKKARESDRLKSTFLASMSHELRTPLNAIIGFSDLIDEDLPVDEIVNFCKTINSSGNHLLSRVC